MKDARCIARRLCSVQLPTFQRITFLSGVSPHVFMLMQLGLPERADGNETINTWSPCRRHAALPLLLRSCKNSPPPSYNPNFNTTDGSVLLFSLDGVPYRPLSFVLRQSTTFLTLNTFTFGSDGKPIPIHIHNVTLEQLQRILAGLAVLGIHFTTSKVC
ncbi:hypothetical protein EV421DRAFT_502498 [Armillaria borealis]|uniref:Uncharacterized protein n=1 Tax=Armillaria borealis TaxID=47425 RepID=A0AA39MD45_9AGAR|nr:hypothetical protein EV421DRAFT_502498 [Armillaria borealis]